MAVLLPRPVVPRILKCLPSCPAANAQPARVGGRLPVDEPGEHGRGDKHVAEEEPVRAARERAPVGQQVHAFISCLT